jgi:hypothetical protein
MTSQTFRDALFAEANGSVPVLLLTITHPQMAQTIRLSSDNAELLDYETQQRGTTSREQRYSFMPMDIQLPEQGDEVEPVLTATLYDVALEVAPLLESVVTPAFVEAVVVSADAPDDVEVSFATFRLTSADIQGDNVSLRLVVDGMGDEPYPADNFTPDGFPGLWLTY